MVKGRVKMDDVMLFGDTWEILAGMLV